MSAIKVLSNWIANDVVVGNGKTLLQHVSSTRVKLDGVDGNGCAPTGALIRQLATSSLNPTRVLFAHPRLSDATVEANPSTAKGILKFFASGLSLPFLPTVWPYEPDMCYPFSMTAAAKRFTPSLLLREEEKNEVCVVIAAVLHISDGVFFYFNKKRDLFGVATLDELHVIFQTTKIAHCQPSPLKQCELCPAIATQRCPFCYAVAHCSLTHKPSSSSASAASVTTTTTTATMTQPLLSCSQLTDFYGKTCL